MTCLTDEQLAQVTLGLEIDRPLTQHVAECAICRDRLASMRTLMGQVTAAHTELERNHAAGRSQLLAELERVPAPVNPAMKWMGLKRDLGGLTLRQRLTVVGVSLSTAALVLVALFVANSARQLSAMERVAKQIREATSFNYRISQTDWAPPREKRYPWVWHRDEVTYWQAPPASQSELFGSMYSELKCRKGKGTDPGNEEKVKESIYVEEIHPSGKPGILIDHMTKTYWRVPILTWQTIGEDSPVQMVRAVREGVGEIVDDLGTREIGGKQALGYVVAVKKEPPFHTFDIKTIEIWIDPATDLPVEFRLRQKEDEDSWKREFVVTDCRWNIEIDPKLFEPTPPEGYKELPRSPYTEE